MWKLYENKCRNSVQNLNNITYSANKLLTGFDVFSLSLFVWVSTTPLQDSPYFFYHCASSYAGSDIISTTKDQSDLIR